MKENVNAILYMWLESILAATIKYAAHEVQNVTQTMVNPTASILGE